MAEALGRSADYRVLRRLMPRAEFAETTGRTTKTGILLDAETTGLDHRKNEIIELGMVKFDYLPDGRIARCHEPLGDGAILSMSGNFACAIGDISPKMQASKENARRAWRATTGILLFAVITNIGIVLPS